MWRLITHRLFRYNLIVWVLLGGALLVWAYPFAWVVFSAFKTPLDLFGSGVNLLPKVWTLDNFVRAWTQAKFSTYLLNSAYYSCSATALSVIIAGMAGYVLARFQFPGSRLIYGLILAMLFLPGAASIIPVFQLMRGLHLLNTSYAVILTLVGGGGFSTLLFVGYFKNIPSDLYDAAVMDGADFVQQFLLILPLARPIIATTVIFTFMGAWNEYFTPLVFTFSRPELRTLAVGLRAFEGQFAFDWSGFTAATVISVLPTLIIFIIFQDYFVNGLAGAVKG